MQLSNASVDLSVSFFPQAYFIREKVPLFLITAHSTRNVGASWDIYYQASVAQVSKAATWFSVHTFL